MYRVLICEDSKEVRDFIKDFFEQKGINIIEAWNGYEALELLDSSIDIVLLDIMMPGINGYEVCKEIRSKYDIPIIIISALSEEENQLKGYKLGADDYITKPFKPSVLYAKVLAMMKRKRKKEVDIMKAGKIELDINKYELIINENRIKLTKKEYLLMKYFIEHKNRVLTREELLNNVWGYDYFGDGRAVDTYVKRLRRHLGSYDCIKTIIKTGYMLEVSDNESV